MRFYFLVKPVSLKEHIDVHMGSTKIRGFGLCDEQLHQRCQIAQVCEYLAFIARETPKIALAVLRAAYLCVKRVSYFTEF
jgi:hypothetical protein